MTKYDILTLKAAVLYILSKNENTLGRIHLCKILYFANQKHLARYGRNIIEDTFYNMKNGPVPTKLYDLIKSNIESGGKYDTVLKAISIDGHNVIAQEEYDELDLSETDIECLNESFEENINFW